MCHQGLDAATCDMQTSDGRPAQSTVSSELAAMFTFAVLPTLRKHYYDPDDPGKRCWQTYEKQCAEFAEDAGIPIEERHRITVPAYISMDWDKRHNWLRECIASPGRSEAARRSCELARLQEQSPAVAETLARLEPSIEKGLPGPSNRSSEISLRADDQRRIAQEQDAWLNLQKEYDMKKGEEAESVAEFRRICSVDMYLQAFFAKSQREDLFLTITPEQYMPLSEVSPDIHSPIEHLVRTIKADVKKKFQKPGNTDAKLKQGRTYQVWINNAVRSKANGEAGRHHITSSVKKQEIICKILAANAGTIFSVAYQFGDGPNVKKNHQVVGTAGAWIKNTLWT